MWRGFWLAEGIFSHMRFDFSHGVSSLRSGLRGRGAIKRRGLNGPVGGYGRLRCGITGSYEAAGDERELGPVRTKRDCASAFMRRPPRSIFAKQKFA